MHSCESWIQKKVDEERISDFEMKGLRQILYGSRAEKRTNEWYRTGKSWSKARFSDQSKRQNLLYFGHIIWKPPPCLQKNIIQETISGHRRRKPLRTSWEGNGYRIICFHQCTTSWGIYLTALTNSTFCGYHAIIIFFHFYTV